jgi:hypothetical protein
MIMAEDGTGHAQHCPCLTVAWAVQGCSGCVGTRWKRATGTSRADFGTADSTARSQIAWPIPSRALRGCVGFAAIQILLDGYGGASTSACRCLLDHEQGVIGVAQLDAQTRVLFRRLCKGLLKIGLSLPS